MEYSAPDPARSDEGPMAEAAPKTLAEAVYIRLRQDVLSGKLKPAPQAFK